jgi:putative transcriptional regulator
MVATQSREFVRDGGGNCLATAAGMADNTRNKLFRARARQFLPPPNPMTAPEDRLPGARRRLPRGERAGLEFAPPDVLAIRGKFAASQKEFAQLIGISPETLRNWERARRAPCGPSRALLRVMQAEPEIVAKVLRWHTVRELEQWEH